MIEKFNFKSKKKVAPSWLSYVVAVSYILIVIFVADSTFEQKPLGLFIALVIGIIDIILNFALSWYTYADVKIENNTLTYDVHTNISVMGTDYTRYKVDFDEIKSYKIKGNKVTIKGKIKRKEPKMQVKEDKKLVLLDTDEIFRNKIKEIIDEKVNSSNG